jgi:hypothetical protein
MAGKQKQKTRRSTASDARRRRNAHGGPSAPNQGASSGPAGPNPPDAEFSPAPDPPRNNDKGKKRARDFSDPPEEPPLKKKAAEQAAKKAEQKRRQARRDEHHIPPSKLSKGDKSLQVTNFFFISCHMCSNKIQAAFHVHIYLLWGVYDSVTVPEMPSDLMLQAFAQRFTTADAWDEIASRISTDHSEAMGKIRQLRLAVSTYTGPIANSIKKISDEHLQAIFSTVLAAGFSAWRPDLLGGTVDSLYNRALENIATSTFQHVAGSHCYIRMSPDLTKLRDSAFLRKLYRNFVFSTMHKRVLADARTAGAVLRKSKQTTAYKARINVSFLNLFNYITKFLVRLETLVPRLSELMAGQSGSLL